LAETCNNSPTKALHGNAHTGNAHYHPKEWNTSLVRQFPYATQKPSAYLPPIDQRPWTAIEWRQVFHGRFATEWQRLQTQHLRRNGITKITLTGQSWTISMIIQLWTEIFDPWDQLNNLVHGNDKTTSEQLQKLNTSTPSKIPF
jgi:hypothetical protein